MEFHREIYVYDGQICELRDMCIESNICYASNFYMWIFPVTDIFPSPINYFPLWSIRHICSIAQNVQLFLAAFLHE